MDHKKIILIANYIPDKQRSMNRYAEQLYALLKHAGWTVFVVRPPVIFGCIPVAKKWVGYVDKYILFPFILIARCCVVRPQIVHIADHSNAMYAIFAIGSRSVVTVHDMLAVRAGLGEDGTGCKASRAGQYLQKWILSGLRSADSLVAVSQQTASDVERIAGSSVRCTVVPNFIDNSFRLSSPVEHKLVRLELGIPDDGLPYVFHVGSSLARKNRLGVLKAYEAACALGWKGWLVFAGSSAAADIERSVENSAYASTIIFVGAVSDLQLMALYGGAHCLLFPSYSEGFGWPCIEAGACGCPVLASNTTSIPEVCGLGAQLFHPDDHRGMAIAIIAMNDRENKDLWSSRSRENANHYMPDRVVGKFELIYRSLL